VRPPSAARTNLLGVGCCACIAPLHVVHKREANGLVANVGQQGGILHCQGYVIFDKGDVLAAESSRMGRDRQVQEIEDSAAFLSTENRPFASCYKADGKEQEPLYLFQSIHKSATKVRKKVCCLQFFVCFYNI